MTDSQDTRDLPDSVLYGRICATHGTKSARIRALAASGWPRAKIAKQMGLRYQHVRNVLVDDERREAKPADPAAAAAAPAVAAAAQPGSNGEAVPSERLLDLLRRARAEPADRRQVTVAVNAALLAAAAELGIDIGDAIESRLGETIAAMARARWLDENRAALEAHNRFVERDGLWSDGLRQF